jgi:hypothetical protein
VLNRITQEHGLASSKVYLIGKTIRAICGSGPEGASTSFLLRASGISRRKMGLPEMTSTPWPSWPTGTAAFLLEPAPV